MAFNPKSLENLRPMSKGDPSRNPRGMTSEVMKRIQANADKASQMQEILLNAQIKVAERLAEEGKHDLVAAMLKAEVNTLARDTQDRAWGKAQQSLDLSSEDGSAAMPTTIRLVAAKTEEDGDG